MILGLIKSRFIPIYNDLYAAQPGLKAACLTETADFKQLSHKNNKQVIRFLLEYVQKYPSDRVATAWSLAQGDLEGEMLRQAIITQAIKHAGWLGSLFSSFTKAPALTQYAIGNDSAPAKEVSLASEPNGSPSTKKMSPRQWQSKVY